MTNKKDTFKSLREEFKNVAFVINYRPDARPEWKSFKYFIMRISDTRQVYKACRTLKELRSELEKLSYGDL